MEISITTQVIIPVALGLLGFVEPCTIGGHLLFLDTQKTRAARQKLAAVGVFIVVRSLVAALVGASAALLGARLIGAQTGLWLVFGSVYLVIGAAFLLGRAGVLKRGFDLSPNAWKHARSPGVLGIAFGLNIPACAAPILFGLLGMAATSGTALAGALMMFLFGLALSAPLLLFAVIPRLAALLERLGAAMRRNGWVLGLIFVALGLWSVWFGLFVDPANWSHL